MNTLKRLKSLICCKQVDVTYLHNVISENSAEGNEKLHVFLQDGGNPNTCFTVVKKRNKKRKTPILRHAFNSNNFSAVEMLYDFGANPNFKKKEKYPVLVFTLIPIENMEKAVLKESKDICSITGTFHNLPLACTPSPHQGRTQPKI